MEHDLLSVMLSSGRGVGGDFEGVAPGADLVLVRALDEQGRARRAELADAVEWVVAQRDRFGIRVLHLPLAAVRRPGELQDPLAPALTDARLAGIVVVAPAGDAGPDLAAVAAFSSAAVSGLIALLLEERPWLTPDELKPRLLAAARGYTWSEEAGKAYTWSEGAARGFTWSEEAARSFTWSEEAAESHDPSPGAVGNRTRSEGAGRTFTWSELTAGSLVWVE